MRGYSSCMTLKYVQRRMLTGSVCGPLSVSVGNIVGYHTSDGLEAFAAKAEYILDIQFNWGGDSFELYRGLDVHQTQIRVLWV